ncbi:pyrroline-5-carboxylate reductase [Selenihalanaerobacter shriftii]|uniref:Pyrroline-5-carboxylate reductase n=1 Tax=Selenihalanaerobacter shriftii TaxID=142842 RepID=A0A1T4JKF3_9FIRM|nr:pyrroline-5-carboxylate reductase [Selenihalanaerobacter shriftii]SJZ30655.1 pyrroline-5-carboxylate reductase [Selenihalanaerobacter shriftii]
MSEYKLGFIGAGSMAEALISGLIDSGKASSKQIIASDITEERRELIEMEYGIKTISDNQEVVAKSDYVILAVKPQVIGGVLEELNGSFTKDQKVFSIAAGVSTAKIEEIIGVNISVVRIMPNTPALVKEGAIAYSLGSYASQELGEEVEELLNPIGTVVQVKEKLMDVVTGLSGSGPAYVLLVLEALVAGGIKMGLSQKKAKDLAIQTLIGTAKLAAESDQHLAALKDQVTSPAGTTAEGLYKLEEAGLRAGLMEAVIAATERSKEL